MAKGSRRGGYRIVKLGRRRYAVEASAHREVKLVTSRAAARLWILIRERQIARESARTARGYDEKKR